MGRRSAEHRPMREPSAPLRKACRLCAHRQVSNGEYVAGPQGSGKEVRNLVFACDVVLQRTRGRAARQTTRFTERLLVGRGGMRATGGRWRSSGRRSIGAAGSRGSEGPFRAQVDLHIVLTGSGAYEGLTNVRHASGGVPGARWRRPASSRRRRAACSMPSPPSSDAAPRRRAHHGGDDQTKPAIHGACGSSVAD